MVEELRQKFNSSFSGEKYREMLADFEKDFPGKLDFRVSESPFFVSEDLKNKLKSAFDKIIEQINAPGFIEKTDRAIPEEIHVENETKKPGCLAVDFAITLGENGEFEPQLIELQGFPSLFAYQTYLAYQYKKHFDINESVTPYFGGRTKEEYLDQMGRFFLGDSKPENTILLEIHPELQKTRIDFAITEKDWGIPAVCATEVKRSGKELYYTKNGKNITIERIYNRLIFDDLDRNYPGLKLEADFHKEANVHWISHPNWFFRLSKFSLPLFSSPFIPESHYLADFKTIPEDLENYVLKPLFSFAGAGVIIDVKREDIERVKNPENYLLQRKISYDPCIMDTEGKLIKCEIRLLAIWPEGSEEPELMVNLGRMSRGKMIGVDFNKDFDWVGGTVAYFES